MKTSLVRILPAALVGVLAMNAPVWAQTASSKVGTKGQLDRTVLPIPPPAVKKITEPDWRKATGIPV